MKNEIHTYLYTIFRSLKEMQLAYFQHQNSLSVAQEAYYLKMASLADKLNVLADIAIDKIHKNE